MNLYAIRHHLRIIPILAKSHNVKNYRNMTIDEYEYLALQEDLHFVSFMFFVSSFFLMSCKATLNIIALHNF